ncbi:hypothetical protein QFC22_000210 [Naganishia vaughanmartiniae]|uniref:Uncharacterized protein n=1 Tax=Naganishia vaughanmartiniae TaxID=1424756 RepID=A0ACC2XNR3_9TREE|nr:hypothetical protein QFC22_000210 [Naganishia vaughanmartiniae]
MTSSRGMTAYEREKRAMAPYRQDGSASETTLQMKGKTEFDVLKENLRFIREDEDPKDVTYEERLARAYESKLFKEYALLETMSEQGIPMPPLQAFELPFAYVEAGQKKQALVKVKVCERCARKVTYKGSGDDVRGREGRDQRKERRRPNPTYSQEQASAGQSDKYGTRSVNGRIRRSESPRRR